MGAGRTFLAIASRENIAFLLINRVPRHALSRFMRWFSKIEFSPVRALSIAVWRRWSGADLSEASTKQFQSLHHAFTRSLRPGARVADPDPAIIACPCDAVVGAFGRIEGGLALQIKGMAYPVVDLFGSSREAGHFEGGWYVTLRLTAGMVHRFHAPHDIVAEQLRYISGDTWNVHPIALKRIERLFCKNERAPMVIRIEDCAHRLVMVPVASVLAASIRLPWLDPKHPVRQGGQRTERFEHRFAKGEQMGWFEHGSTIVLFGPPACPPVKGLAGGQAIRMGQPLLRIVDMEPI